MRYMGGKYHQSTKIVEILQSHRKPNQIYLEPFVGAANVIEKMNGVCIASDINSDVISLLRAVQSGWKPPVTLTRKQYDACKKHPNLLCPALRAFVGFGCSYAGKYFGGFASGENRDFANECYRGLITQKNKIQHVSFVACDYRQLNPFGMLIYCDPPYAQTTEYNGISSFDSKEFWEVMYKWSCQDNTVFVSEYSAPYFTEQVYEWDVKTTLVHKGNGLERTDKLFKVCPYTRQYRMAGGW